MSLTRLIRKDVPFTRDEKCEDSFQTIKDKLTSMPILTLPFGSGGFVIYCDASLQGLGCVLMQQGKVIA